MALGGNLGMETVFVLTNHLHSLLTEDRKIIKTSDLDNVFEKCQVQQMPRAQAIYEISSLVTRAQAWDTPWLKFSSLYMAPHADPSGLPNAVGEIVRKAPVLDFLPLDREWPKGVMAWENGEGDAKRAAAAVAAKASGDAKGRLPQRSNKTQVSPVPNLAKFLVGWAYAAFSVLWSRVART